MSDRIDKPRVFLSHSKKDIEFIDALYEDLRRCQIDPWLDSEEIRHGHPWLSAIFEDGLPTCDCVLVYLTENSIESGMVKKEVDVGVLNKLKDNSISFLPYVNRSDVRSSLRADLQVLQAPEWNKGNYKELLPRVVSEIWRSYMERKISGAISGERVKRLEAELEIEKMKSISGDSPFTQGEMLDFEFILGRINRSFRFFGGLYQGRETIFEDKEFETNLLVVLPELVKDGNRSYTNYRIEDVIKEYLLPSNDDEAKKRVELYDFPDFTDELLMYGFLESVYIKNNNNDSMFPIRLNSTKYYFTEKFDRFRYWLAYTNKPIVKLYVNET